MRSRVAVILNEKAGSTEGNEQIENVKRAFSDAGLDATFHLFGGNKKLDSVVREALDSGAEIVAAGGGDGTISGVVNEIIGTEKILAVIPLGTLNHFSKDLEIPQEIAEAVAVIANGTIRHVDIGEVNGTYFVNNSSIGLYPRIVRKREQQQRIGRGKWWAAAWATWRFFILSPFVKIKLELGDNVLHRKTSFVFVGNNQYEIDLYNIGRRESLDAGNLSVYLLRRSGRIGLFLLVFHTILGRLHQMDDFEEFKTRSLTIETKRKRILVAIDGEVSVLESPLEYRIHAGKLKVIAPAKNS